MSSQSASQIILTHSACDRIRALLAKEPADSFFRIAVEGGGCSGFQYQFAISDQPASGDVLIHEPGVRVVIDETSMAFLTGSELDFVDDLMGQSFRVNNPNAKSSCGCGTSFSL